MWGQIIAAVVGAVAGGVYNGVTTAKSVGEKVEAYKDAANEVREAAKQYSGKQAYDVMTQEGQQMANTAGTMAGDELAAERLQQLNPGVTGAGATTNASKNAEAASNTATSAAQSGLEQGMTNAADTMAAKYNAATTRANQLMKQADIDYNVANQRAQEVMNAAGNVANTFNSIRGRRSSNGTRTVTE